MTLIFPNRLLLPMGSKAAHEVSRAISNSLNEKEVSAIVPFSKSEKVTRRYEDAISIHDECKIETGLIVCTSGTTGNPKAVEISSKALVNAANKTNQMFNDSADWILAINPAFIGGLMVLARAIISNQNWIYGLDESDKFNPDLFIAKAMEVLSKNKKVRTSLVNAQLSTLVSQGHTETLKKFDAILIGGGQISNSLYEQLKNDGVNLIRTYGMTETCGGVVWDGFALNNVLIRIDHPASDGVGQIAIKSDSNATCYHGKSNEINKLNQSTFSNDWVLTKDLGSLKNGELKVIGRNDDIVISGGNNVSLHAIENVIKDQLGIEDAVVFSIPDEKWGAIVAAVIVGNCEISVIQKSIEIELGKAAVPRIIKNVLEIPLLPNGKVDIDSLK
ncbi:MAG: AMP-binding protein [Candidatus Nanopelagicales bacterium]